MIRPIGPFRKMLTGDGGRLLSPYLPLLYPHLELYLDSRLGISGVADGATLASWADQSGHSPTRDGATASAFGFTDPTYWSTTASKLTPKGKPVVEWGLTTASPGNLLKSTGSFLWPTQARGYTFYYYGLTVTKTTPTYPAVNQGWFGATNTISALAPLNILDSGTGPAPGRSIGIADDNGGGNPHQFSQLSAISNQWKMHTIVYPTPMNGTLPPLYYLNGVAQTEVAGPGNLTLVGPGTNFYTLGGNWTGNIVVKGRQGFALWFSDIHSQATISLFNLWASIFFGF